MTGTVDAVRTGGRLGPATGFLVLGTFASTIANTLVTVPLTAIVTDLGAPLTAGTLVVVAFNLTCAAMLPFAGWLGDRLGRRRLFLISMIGVAAGATGAALAPSLPLLVAFRAVQGFSGALVLPTVLALLTAAATPEHRGRAVSWWAAANGAGQAAGPTLGGFLADATGWRSVFAVIVPFALVAFAGALRGLPRDEPRAVRLEWAGALTLTLGTVGVLLGAAALGAVGPAAAVTWGGFGAGLASLVMFVLVERRATRPFVPLGLFGDARFARSAVAALVQMMCLTATLLAVPLFLLAEFGIPARDAGLLVVAVPVVMTVLAPVVGRLTEGWSPRLALRCGLLVLAAAEAALAVVLGTASALPALVAGCAAIGCGMALTQTPAATGAARSAQLAGSGAGLGVFNSLRFVGAALGGVVVALAVGDGPSDRTATVVVALVCAGSALVALGVSFAGRVRG
ncbi:drug resistance transporter, EmrB/QacA subfamily [Pseudonocardia ammonioxydans]|uniref:Drug resistance transporter, EmrB/QacA subfamily n=1 Tax=Pseudonocardia ammonioxydans TaxID=260086 RepID=A0A1I4YCI8_PSUAM|nr:MFS transporter [Pseudonocardia ammonioxydans]SFN35279.1 drug resistance transporter, EmrB/QacA subfamily [Pseudonocardia ammonioxydans]